MLLAENVEGLLPDWAFFVRAVIDTSELRPTASREALFDDGNLEATRDALGAQLRGWLVRLGNTDPAKLDRFLGIHQLGVKALALHDDEMLRLVHRWLRFETNHGRMTTAELQERSGEIRYVATVEEFRQLAAVAAAQQITVVNGGYTYDSELLERLPEVVPDLVTTRFDPTELSTSFDSLDPDTELRLRPFVQLAQDALDSVGCEVVVRAFEPAGLPALYLVDRSAQFASELRATKDRADALWSEVLGALDTHDDSRPQLVLNHRSPLVRRMASLDDPELAQLAVEGLYGHALMLGYHPISPADSALVNRSFLGLLDQAVPTAGGPDPMNQELVDRLQRAESAPYGKARSALLEDVVRRADAAGEEDLAFRSRLSLVTAYVMGGEPRKSLVPFARCVADWDASTRSAIGTTRTRSSGASSTRRAR